MTTGAILVFRSKGLLQHVGIATSALRWRFRAVYGWSQCDFPWHPPLAKSRSPQRIQYIFQLAHYGHLTPKDASYLLDPQEIRARAYTQYIVVESKSGRLQYDSVSLRKREARSLETRWDDAEFAALAPFIREVLRAMKVIP